MFHLPLGLWVRTLCLGTHTTPFFFDAAPVELVYCSGANHLTIRI
jgi:hypothetical protein